MMLPLLLLACRWSADDDTAESPADTGTTNDTGECTTPPPCSASYEADTVEDGVRTADFLLPGDDGTVVHTQVRWPDRDPDACERWPVAVVLPGGWAGTDIPAGADGTTVAAADGLVVVHLDLPGAGASDGENDRRGASQRAGVATVMRYAAGLSEDPDGCTIAGRTAGGDPDDLYLVGTSNGGNLAAAVLADPGLDLPPVNGAVFWETPASPQFATVEFGIDPNVYQAGSCALDDDSRIRCGIPTGLLHADDGAPSKVCFDTSGDGTCGAGDVTIHGVEDLVSGDLMLDPDLLADLSAAGFTLHGFAGQAAATEWWAQRDAALAAPAVIAAHPELPIILVGSEEDHVLPLSDHPHVFGLGEALQQAGARWTRLNPGSTWLPDNTEENEPNMPLTIADHEGNLLPEDVESPLLVTLAASVKELSSRTREGAW
jgi:acetyl esterase/lipase